MNEHIGRVDGTNVDAVQTRILKQFKIEADEFHRRGRANRPNRSHQGVLSVLDFDLAQVCRLCRSVSNMTAVSCA